MIHPYTDKLEHTIELWQHFAPCLGANVTVSDSINGVWSSACGFKSLNPSQPLESNESFYLYSITKTFTAIVVLKLGEKGLISLDDPIVNYLTNLAVADSVTVRHLLNHTSGIPSYTDLPEYMPATKESPSDPWTFEHVINLTCGGVLDFDPGGQWHYSNSGYMLLLLMIESVTGESYSKNIDKYIVQAIGLKNTYVAENVDEGRVTNGYRRYLNSDDKMENITNIYNPWWCKTGLIVSTSLEVTKLFQSLFNGKLVNSESLSQMTEVTPISPLVNSRFSNPGYGLGLVIESKSGHGLSYGHGGDGPGFNAWSVYYPEFNGREIIVAVLCNTTMGGHPLYLVKDILRVLK
ncbi:Beta-lactamase class C-like and penicillin binding proteins (PBPs) superfamily [hydrothermal vent metagenome]|uniref:Beta-lactamase class C-like and penicillin binding proteins (PBPs) superfamily n=1 Tax=hydrothermal vent metagenome TaxID=652676 RepID=A0A3B0XSY7_9ZZZZ